MKWQNPLLPADVNADTFVSPQDALLIINDLNENQPRRLTESDGIGPPYFDVNGDDFISPFDSLLVINTLNENARAQKVAALAKTAGLKDAPSADSSDHDSSSEHDSNQIPEVVGQSVNRVGHQKMLEFAAAVDSLFFDSDEFDSNPIS